MNWSRAPRVGLRVIHVVRSFGHVISGQGLANWDYPTTGVKVPKSSSMVWEMASAVLSWSTTSGRATYCLEREGDRTTTLLAAMHQFVICVFSRGDENLHHGEGAVELLALLRIVAQRRDVCAPVHLPLLSSAAKKSATKRESAVPPRTTVAGEREGEGASQQSEAKCSGLDAIALS